MFRKIFLCCYTLFVLIFWETQLLDAKPYWIWSQPLPTGNFLQSIFPANDKVVYAAGSLGTILRSIDAGVNWKVLYAGTNFDIFEISAIKENICIVVGEAGNILKSDDGGDDWIAIDSPTDNDLHDIFFVNRFTGFACGLNGTILKTTNTGDSWKDISIKNGPPLFCLQFINVNTGIAGGYNCIVKTTDGGKSWYDIHPDLNNSAVRGIYADEKNIFAVSDSPDGKFLKSTNGGSTWTVTSLELSLLYEGSADLVRSMKFVNDSTGFAVTTFGTIVKTNNAGILWTKDSLFRPSAEKSFVMSDIQSFGTNNLKICGAGGNIFSSSDCGKNWSVKSGNKKNIRSNFFVSTAAGFAAGENGTVLKTEDGGLTWNELKHFTPKSLNTLYFMNAYTGYAAGNDGAIFKTSNAGELWTNQTHYTRLDYNFIHFINYDDGVAGGGNPENGRAFIYRTSNAGINWFEVFDSLGMGILNSVSFVNSNVGIATGDNGNILHTYDAGFSWTSENISVNNLNSISFTDQINGMIAADNGIVYVTSNGGFDWSKSLTGVYSNLNAIMFREDYALACGSDGSIICSTNKGSSWQIFESITDNNLFSVSSAGNLVAFGEYGTILYSPRKFPFKKIDRPPVEKVFLSQNWPNPFNSQTRIGFDLETGAIVRIKLFDLTGKEILKLSNEFFEKGHHELIVNADEINPLPSGVYFYTLSTPGFYISRKMIIMK